ncbi:hypothetical protein EK21DRAFT_105418 [Setomelanomma holmii]|uniref:Uncharacterized protein n=1 Tax=Setomelanomma holmii TaxID=210430 RepID=A0A9P4GX11_9PLEO|nr:hypothetical protein EK21DRAFT_105418 [Setomelanomma holmii]
MSITKPNTDLPLKSNNRKIQSTNQERRPNADRIDDADLSGDYYANTAFHMAQITAPTGDVNVKRGSFRKDILLTHVAYIPGFLTNLFALGRCRRSGIHFDSGRNILYKDKVLSLLDAEEADRPPRHKLVSMAAKSSKERLS